VAINISVILCTYNRCQSLAKALESIAATTFSNSLEREVLVIDNNSSDRTREVVEGFCRRFPDHFRYVFEPQQGKSHALNTGIREARGEVLAFTDDDVTVEPTWLENLTAELFSDEWAGAGGRIFPEREVKLPNWLTLEGPQSMAGLLVLFDRGPVAGELTVPPFGANMAFRKAMFEEYGGFRTDLGPPPKLRGEDTEFCLRLVKASQRFHYAPSAIVYHEIPEKRLTKSYFLSWWFGHGRTTIRLREKRPHVKGISPEYLGLGNRVLKMLPGGIWRWMRESDPQARFFHKCWVWKTAGEAVEFFSLATESKKRPRSSDLEPRSSTNGNI
jgi:glycosyltransferase involved in cell wall biosynthesis